jgi:hypothetical protein
MNSADQDPQATSIKSPYADAAELRSLLEQVFAASYDTPDANLLLRHRLALAFVFTGPDVAVLLDGRGGQEVKVEFAEPGPVPTAAAPDLMFRMSGETAHPFWTGELNVMTALGLGKIQLQGSLISALKIAPSMPLMQESYRRAWAARERE